MTTRHVQSTQADPQQAIIIAQITSLLEHTPLEAGYRYQEWLVSGLWQYVRKTYRRNIPYDQFVRMLRAGWLTQPASNVPSSTLHGSETLQDALYWLVKPQFNAKGRLNRAEHWWHVRRNAGSTGDTAGYELRYVLDAPPRSEVRLLLVGVTGTGKSSTANTLLQVQAAEIGRFDRTTQHVSVYPLQLGQRPLKLIDTPGLADDLPEEQRDLQYLAEVWQDVTAFNRLLYVTRLNDNRVDADEKRSIKLITEAFGPSVWRRAVLLLTHADKIEQVQLVSRFDGRLSRLRDEIRAYAGDANSSDLYALALDNQAGCVYFPAQWPGQNTLFPNPYRD